MSLATAFISELEYELPNTRRLLERVPADQGPWKPHPKSSALGHLAQLVSRLPGVMADIVIGVDLDLAAGPGYSFQSTATLLREFDRNVERVNNVLRNVKPADWELGWNVRAGEQVYSSASRKDALRNTINHFVHHRGQLTVYLREVDVPIPQLYGPTADEK